VENDVAAALREMAQSLPPLRGVFHAAMVLEDSLLVNLDRHGMQRVMAPKILGGWNLHQQTATCPLDHFVLFSSLSSVFGHAGQGNYAAANAFLDLLAHHRRARGQRCLTVNWGYLGEVGYLAERRQLGERLERQGVLSFSVRQALDALNLALKQEAIQMSVMKIDWARWRGLGVTGRVSPRFEHLLQDSRPLDDRGNRQARSLDTLRTTPPEERTALVDQLLRDQVSRILGVEPGRLDREAPLLDLGLDSLMAVELRSWIDSEMRVNLSIVQLMRSPNLAHVTEIICHELVHEKGVSADEKAHQPSDLDANPRELLEKLDALSDEAVDGLLTAILDENNHLPIDTSLHLAVEPASYPK